MKMKLSKPSLTRLISRHSKTVGKPPGTLVHVGREPTGPVKLSVIDYGPAGWEHQDLESAESCEQFKHENTISWINIEGVHEPAVLEKFGEIFKIHPLVLEDIMNTSQRPKFEDFGDYFFVVVKMLTFDEKEHIVIIEQVSLICGKGYVLSFQERAGDVFDIVRERIRAGKGRVKQARADYLTYALMDAVVDNYFTILEKMADKVEDIEQDLMAEPTPQTLNSIHRIKREMLYIRKGSWPLREVISSIQKSDNTLLDAENRAYWQDLHDHIMQILDIVETMRDVAGGMFDTYMSNVSNRMNSVMQMLTIIATIFIPLTFIAGIYGMNFSNMPEMEYEWAYPLGFWSVILAVSIIMIIYFKRKKWL